MAVEERVTQLDDLFLLEIFKNPVLFTEFVENYDKLEDEEVFELSLYQKEMLMDFSSYISVVAGRSAGKTVTVVSKIKWTLVYNLFPNDYIVYHVPNKVHLEPVWSALIRSFRTNTVLKLFIMPNSGINSSDFTLKLTNQALLMCRIAGQTGTGVSVIGLHSPLEFVDECLTAQTKISSPDNTKKRVKDLKVGDSVYSWDGLEVQEDRVSKISIVPAKEVYELRYTGGTIKCSPEHRFYTKDGYKELKDIKMGDTIFIMNSPSKRHWTEEETDILLSMVKDSWPAHSIAKALNRSEVSVFKHLYKLGYNFRDSRDIGLTDEERQILTGSFLGDGAADIYLNRASYVTNHGYVQKNYVDWLNSKLYRIVRCKPQVRRNGGWGRYTYSMHTMGMEDIKEITDKLYINNKKTVTQEYLDLLTPLGLAVWYMDDGSESGMLSTHGFSKEENELISAYLLSKWGIENKVGVDTDKNLYFILINAKGKRALNSIIKEYIPDCMKYKIGEGKCESCSQENLDLDILNEKVVIDENPENALEERIVLGIRKVEKTRAKKLYSIETEINHNYFANNILVKNSGYYPWGTWIEMQPTLNTFTAGFQLVVSGVPDGRREKSVNYHCDQENSNFSKYRISSLRNPRFTEEDRQRAVEQYGGEDSDDYIHLVLAQHGKPVFALFDRTMFLIDNSPVYKAELNGLMLGEQLGEYYNRIAILPAVPDRSARTLLGIDLGYTEPSAFVVLYLDHYNRLHFHQRIKLDKVPFPIQEKLINLLDDKYDPMIIGMDKGSGGQGISVYHHLTQDNEYMHKNYLQRLVAIDFSSSIILGMDSEGQEIKSPAKPFATSVLQDFANNHKLIFSNTDLEMVSELERMTYSKTPTGNIVYKTLTVKGGQKGSDHFTTALLCGVLAYYLTNEFIQSKPEKKRLFKPTWFR
jgi:intein/homing endonuclease